jgi:hypothetical protein
MEPARSYRHMKVLVTGASGHLAKRLASADARLHLVSGRLTASGLPGSWFQQYLRGARGAQELLGRIEPESIIHLASESRGGPEIDSVLPTFSQ